MMDHPLRIRFFIVAICLAAITVWGARKPETFDLPDAPQMTWQERLTRTPVHLDDDVMIALRAGYMIEQLGYPGYNRSDKAQPSTSYIAPYVYFLLWKTLPGYGAAWGYVALSLMSAVGTLTVIACASCQTWPGCLLAALLATVLLFNDMQFGHVTPTTARLKIGASPSLAYSLEYAASNGWMAYTALSLCMLLGFAFALSWKRTDGAESMLLGGCAVTVTVAIVNSDVFIAGRMFWMPACVMALMLARIVDWRMPGKWFGWAMPALCVVCLLGAWRAAAENKAPPNSFMATQYDLTRWVGAKLEPRNGVIGFHCLGMAYYLPDFDVADFLGKADELISEKAVKWGPPGHNKWDADATIAKWHPQFIIPALPVSWEKTMPASGRKP